MSNRIPVKPLLVLLTSGGALLFLMFWNSNSFTRQSTADPLELLCMDGDQGQEVKAIDESRISVGKGNPKIDPRESTNSDPTGLRKLKLISHAAELVIRDLEKNEAARSQLLSESDSDVSYSYVFSISPHPDFDSLVNDLTRRYSTELGLVQAAIKLEIQERIGEFFIPEDMTRKIMISVPKDPSAEIRCISGLQDKGSVVDFSKSISLSGPTEVLTVPVNISHWRYQHLLDLAGD